jgi:hypothetical protein
MALMSKGNPRWRVRSDLKAAAAAVVVLCGGVGASVAVGSNSAAPTTYDFGNDPNVTASRSQAQAAEARERQRRATPEAQRERAASRHSYGNAPNEAALATAREKFPANLLSDVWAPPPLPAGHHLVYKSEHGGIVKDDSGRSRAVLESAVPIQVEDSSGDLAPVSLTLHERGEALVPENPLVPLQVEKTAAEGAELPRSGIGFGFASATSAGASAETTVADKAFYPNIARDSDAWIAPTAGGAEAFLQLRSASSPEAHPIDFRLPQGAELRAQADGSGLVEVVKDNAAIGYVLPPSAKDAEGTPVPVSYRISGTRLTVVVDHQSGDFMYPILVDPQVTERDYWQDPPPPNGGGGTQLGYRGWVSNSNRVGTDWINVTLMANVLGTGLYLESKPMFYTHGDFVEWKLTPHRSGIYFPRVEFQSSIRESSACTHLGVWNPTHGWVGATEDIPRTPALTCDYNDGLWDVRCVVASCDWSQGEEGAWATFALMMWGTSTRTQYNYNALLRAAVFLWDHQGPDLSRIAPFGTRNWADSDSVQINGTVPDSGIGLTDVTASASGAGTWSRTSTGPGCDGTRFAPCAASLPTGWTLNSSDLSPANAEGTTSVGVASRDYIDRAPSKSLGQLRIDRSAPLQAIGGTLNTPDGTWIREGSYTLSDSPSDRFSGIQTDQFSVGPAGLAQDTATNYAPGTSTACDAGGNCPTNPPTHNWTWPTSGLDGPHQVAVTTKDPLAHTASKSWTVNVDSRPAALGSGPSGTLWDQRSKFMKEGSYDLHVSATDPSPGSGVSDIQVFQGFWAPGGAEEDPAHATQTCSLACPASMPRDYTFDTTGRLEGTHYVKMVAHDKVTHPTTLADFSFVLDMSAPDVVLSGSLYDGRSADLAPGSYNLHVHATDGDGTVEGTRSGVKSIEVLVDGERTFYGSQPCAGNCSMDRDVPFNTADYGGGDHEVRVITTDQLGHVRESDPFSLSNPCCLGAPSSWGNFPKGTYDLSYGDVNGDGAADAVLRNKLTGELRVGLSTGSTFAPSTPWGSFSILYDVRVADLDGDGLGDVVGRNATTGIVQAGLSTGTSFAAATPWGSMAAAYEMKVADMDGDGLADLVGRNNSSGDFAVGWSHENGFDALQSWGNFPAAYKLLLADVDSDGAADLVGTSASNVWVSISDAGTLGAPTVWGNFGGNADYAVGDADGDGSDDLLFRDRDSDGVSFANSTGASFGEPVHMGSFSGAYDFGTADLNADGNVDIVGRQPLSGDVRAALTTVPLPDGTATVDYVPDPNVELEDGGPSADTAASTNGVTAAAAPSGYPKVGFQDDDRLLYRSRLVGPEPNSHNPTGDPFGDRNAEAEARINQIYDRMIQAGGTLVRFNVFWGWIENAPDPTDPSGFKGGKPFEFNRLDTAIRLARMRGLAIELTLSGGADSCPNGPANSPFNVNARSCFGGQSTTVNPSSSQYQRFVEAVVEHYTRNPDESPRAMTCPADCLRVNYFSLWNEPNQGASKLSTGNPREAPVKLYHDLAVAGYNGWSHSTNRAGAPPSLRTIITNTKLFVGELSSRVYSGYDAYRAKCPPTQTKGKCHISPSEFLREVTQVNGTALIADGVAYHPYQDRDYPSFQGVKSYQGIGRLKAVQDMIDTLCRWGRDVPTENLHCRGSLRGSFSKRPRLYLTEFGYRNRPTGKKSANANQKSLPEANAQRSYWHSEAERALWYGGGYYHKKTRRGAMQVAADSKAQWMILYHMTELQPVEEDPQSQNLWDSGLIGRPGVDQEASHPDDDINGVRVYGKVKNRGGWFGPGHEQQRMAYCSIHAWAVQHDYVPSGNNACP